MLRVATSIVALLFISAAAAGAHEEYGIVGTDELRESGTTNVSLTSYNGSQDLSVTSQPNGLRTFRVDATARIVVNGGVPSNASAEAELVLSPDGRERMTRNDDPAYLTVLTQPFAVALDLSTLNDVSHLRAPVPFQFSSGMTGGDLRGLLSFRGYVKIDGSPTIGMTFTADGPVYSTAAGETARMIGHVRMDGRAFYRTSDALLMKLVTTVVTTGTVAGGKGASQVNVTYYRRLQHITERATPLPPKHLLPVKPVPSPTPSLQPSPAVTGTPKALPR